MLNFHNHGEVPPKGSNYVFVFGSNLKGIHGAGAALVAREHYGAQLGQGLGYSKRSYAIPSKDHNLKTLPIEAIKGYVNTFKVFANEHPEMKFWITGVGTGLAGYTKDQIAPLFSGLGSNCSFPTDWRKYIEPLCYAGVGSRGTPADILDTMRSIGQVLARKGYTLRSGAAVGADQAFEEGANKVKGKKEIWLPWIGFNNHESKMLPTLEHSKLAATLHPVWFKLSQGEKKLHSRNIGQVHGYDLKTPVTFVVCYTSDGVELSSKVTSKTGGTGMAIKAAGLNNIPVFNLGNDSGLERLNEFLKHC